MKWYEWMLVVILILLSNVATLIVIKHHVKTVDLVELVDAKKVQAMESILKGQNPEEAGKSLDLYIKALQEVLKEEKGLVIVKQALLHGGNDITREIRKKVLLRMEELKYENEQAEKTGSE